MEGKAPNLNIVPISENMDAIEEIPKKILKKTVRIEEPVEAVDQNSPVNAQQDGNNANIVLSSEIINLFGYNIPKSTLILLFVLIIIGIFIWNSGKSKKIATHNNDNEEDK